MHDDWTFEDRERLMAEAMDRGDQDMIERLLVSDHFEPSLGAPGGLSELINVTREEKAEERERVRRLYAQRAAIKACWASIDRERSNGYR
jgi:hypothetical protein